MRIVLLGAPGSGKGTQGEKMALHFGIPKLSTGDALRAAKKAGTELGLKAAPLMDLGQLVPDALVYGIVEERLAQPDAQKGFILDGFPRNIAQADVLETMLAKLKAPSISKAIHLHVDDEEIITRLHSRAIKEGRADDTEAVIRERIKIYNAETSPLLDYYQKQGKLVTLEGKGALEEIFARIVAAV
jgi:adenylate kinase